MLVLTSPENKVRSMAARSACAWTVCTGLQDLALLVHPRWTPRRQMRLALSRCNVVVCLSPRRLASIRLGGRQSSKQPLLRRQSTCECTAFSLSLLRSWKIYLGPQLYRLHIPSATTLLSCSTFYSSRQSRHGQVKIKQRQR